MSRRSGPIFHPKTTWQWLALLLVAPTMYALWLLGLSRSDGVLDLLSGGACGGTWLHQLYRFQTWRVEERMKAQTHDSGLR